MTAAFASLEDVLDRTGVGVLVHECSSFSSFGWITPTLEP